MWINGIIVITAVTIAVISLGILLLYRRQMKSFCRQLEFIQRHETNKIISQDIQFKEITKFTDLLNDMIKINHQLEHDYKCKEREIKETMVNLSHDIRTPITSLKGYFELLLEAEDEKERERYSKIIQSRIKSLNEILEQLFTYTRLQNDSYQLFFEECNINKILYDAVFSFYEDFKSRGIEPDISIPNKSFIVWANVAAMKRTFQNIIKNALDHGQEQIMIAMRDYDNRVEIIIKNKFLSEESIDINKIFQRFYKADTSRKHQSTGLGLSIAYELVKCMNGEISAEIEENFFVIILTFSVRESLLIH
jgi:Signal transduction histidine kinase